MADKIVRTFGPKAFATSAANIYNNTSALIYDVLTHIHVVNTAGSAGTFTLFISATTGTETAGLEMFVAQPIAANGVYDWYGRLKLLSTDFIVGHASAITITIMGEGVQGVV
jgi:hypothetical protein